MGPKYDSEFSEHRWFNLILNEPNHLTLYSAILQEWVIKTLMEMWHDRNHFDSRQERQTGLARFINFYNTVKPHAGINNMTPYELLIEFLNCK